MPRSLPRAAGVTLVEAAVIVCLVGIILAVFVPVFARSVSTSKLSEAGEQLARLHAATVAYYEARRSGRTRCVPGAAGPTPAEASEDPVSVVFTEPPSAGHATWEGLGFSPEEPIRFRYTFAPFEAGCSIRSDVSPLITLRAEGDLDGDGKMSRFERYLALNERGELTSTGVLDVVDRVE